MGGAEQAGLGLSDRLSPAGGVQALTSRPASGESAEQVLTIMPKSCTRVGAKEKRLELSTQLAVICRRTAAGAQGG